MATELKIDLLGYKYIVEGLRRENLNEYIIILTNLGGGIVFIGICLYSIIFIKDKRYGKYITLNLVAITLINLIIKMLVHRERPLDIGLIVETSYSFPSGHSMISMAFYGFLIYLIYQKVKNHRRKFFYCSFLSLIILFIGFSRIYLGVHYASDVLAGYSFSLGYLIIYTHIVGKKLGGIMSISKVKQYFKKFGIEDRVIELEESSATVELAAEALGTKPERIAKTLSFIVNDKPILIVTAGNVRIDNAKYKLVFNTKAKMIERESVEEMIGHAAGGVCPFAINDGVEVYLDVSLKNYETVFPACGSSKSAIELTISEMEKYSNYIKWIDVCKNGND